MQLRKHAFDKYVENQPRKPQLIGGQLAIKMTTGVAPEVNLSEYQIMYAPIKMQISLTTLS